MATGKRQDRRSKYANDMHIIHHEIFFSLSLSFSFSLSLSLSVLSRFLSGFFLSLSLSLFFFFWSASTISPWWLFLCVFIRAFFDYSSLPLRTAIHPTSLPFPAFLNFNPLDTWRPSWKTTVTASFHFFSWPFLFPVRHFLFQSRRIHSTFLSDYFSIFLGFFPYFSPSFFQSLRRKFEWRDRVFGFMGLRNRPARFPSPVPRGWPNFRLLNPIAAHGARTTGTATKKTMQFQLCRHVFDNSFNRTLHENLLRIV